MAVFDSTAPHEYFPTKDSDEIIDVYSLAVTPGTDEKFAPQLNDIIKRYYAKLSPTELDCLKHSYSILVEDE